MATRTKRKQKRRISELDSDDASTESNKAEPSKKRAKTKECSKDINQSTKREETADIEAWKCEFCGKLEKHVIKGNLKYEDWEDDWNFSILDICRKCDDRNKGLRPVLKESGDLDRCWTTDETICQWCRVKEKFHALTNDSTTEEWQAAWKAVFGPHQRRVYVNCHYKEREKIKKLGGRFDFDKNVRKWYIPKGMDCAPFAEWMVPRYWK